MSSHSTSGMPGSSAGATLLDIGSAAEILAKDIEDLKNSIKRLEDDETEAKNEKNTESLNAIRNRLATMETRLAKKEDELKSAKAAAGDGGGSAVAGEGGGVGAPSGSFAWSSAWREPEPLCYSDGRLWDFQLPSSWITQINGVKGLQRHYQAWLQQQTDKTLHPLWLIVGGPGTGKSRSLQEFQKILEVAAVSDQNGSDLLCRIQEMYVFNVSFENGHAGPGHIPPDNLIAAHMAYQLQGTSSKKMSWEEFRVSDFAKTVLISHVVEKLVTFKSAERSGSVEKDLTILLCVDGLHHLDGEMLKGVITTLRNHLNQSEAFFMVAASAIVQGPIIQELGLSSQSHVVLHPRPIESPKSFEDLADSPIKQVMVKDMGGHGRALELLEGVLKQHGSSTPNLIMQKVRMELEQKYNGWRPLSNVTAASKLVISILSNREISPGTKIDGIGLSAEELAEMGLFRYNKEKSRLEVAYIWIWLMAETSNLPMLNTVIFCDYDELADKISEGSSSRLSSRFFEEFWCSFRVMRSLAYPEGASLSWQDFHSGATFGPACNINFINKHLSVVHASHQVGTKKSQNVQIETNEGVPTSDKTIVLNRDGAPAGDSMVPLKFPGKRKRKSNEVHQLKRYDVSKLAAKDFHQLKRYDVSKLAAKDLIIERAKAADDNDFFILVCSGAVADTELPPRTAVINVDSFERYFGPFAGRAFAFTVKGPVDINTANLHQLSLCTDISESTAVRIMSERRKAEFEDSDDLARRVKLKFGAKSEKMNQFVFLNAKPCLPPG